MARSTLRISWPAVVVAVVVVVGSLVVGRRGRRLDWDSTMWLYIGVPIVGLTLVICLIDWRLRRARADRLWAAMSQHAPEAKKLLLIVLPTIQRKLKLLGWRSRRATPLSTPTLGLVFGDAIQVWQADVPGPTLTIPYGLFDAVRRGPVDWPLASREGIWLHLGDPLLRSHEVKLDLRLPGFKPLTFEELDDLVESLKPRLAMAPPATLPLER